MHAFVGLSPLARAPAQRWGCGALTPRAPARRAATAGRAAPRAAQAAPAGAYTAEVWDAAADEPVADDAWRAMQALVPHAQLRTLMKPGQYLGNELGAVRRAWDSGKVRFVLAYPDLYSIGMSSTGHVVLYSCLNDAGEDMLCDRAYLPYEDMQSALQGLGKPLFAVESKRPLGDFHVVGMSISYELCATNCLKMMELAHIPRTWAERDAVTGAGPFVDGPPLVFAGGLSVTSNPEPYAEFFDFFSLGDGEVALPAIGHKIAEVLDARPDISREELTLVLARDVPGVYAPRFYDMHPVSGSVRRNRDDVPARPQRQNAMPEPWRATALVPHTDAVHDRLSIEVRRGCTRGCRFCLPGMVQRPARDVEPDGVVEAVKKGVEATGYNEFSLLSLSCSDWLSLPSVGLRLKDELADHNISLSLGSQRVDRFDENIARVAGGLRKSGLTFAPEAGTQRMRDVINKGLTDAELLRGVMTAYEQGWQNVKLYFLIGLPTETDADVMGIANTIRFLQKKCRAPGRRRLSLTVTISNFTPKPWTPFQWHTVSAEDFARKQRMLKREFQFIRDVKMNFTDTRLSSMEEFIGRGDRRMSKVIARAHEQGAGMDGWFENMATAYSAWCSAIEDTGLTWKYRLAEKGEWNIADTPVEEVRGLRGWRDVARAENRDRHTLLAKDDAAADKDDRAQQNSALDMELPWDHIDTGIDKGWLRDELMLALSSALTPDCAFNDCSHCGVCGDDMGNNVTLPPPPLPSYTPPVPPSMARAQRIRLGLARTGAASMSSHLDTARMLDRLLRRAALPISFDGGFHPQPRVSAAAALPLGATASNELVDFILTSPVPPPIFAARVAEHLPPGMSISSHEEVPVIASSASVLMHSADYIIALHAPDAAPGAAPDYDALIADTLSAPHAHVPRVSKRGVESTRDLRAMLRALRRATPAEAAPVLAHVGARDWPPGAAVLAARVQLANDGALGPDALVELLRVASGVQGLQLLHAHRQRILLGEDEKFLRGEEVRRFEARRRAMKPSVNAWARVMMSRPALNDVWAPP